jgi:hypothetical protein
MWAKEFKIGDVVRSEEDPLWTGVVVGKNDEADTIDVKILTNQVGEKVTLESYGPSCDPNVLIYPKLYAAEFEIVGTETASVVRDELPPVGDED